ncbi:MAG: (2Fe-2S)-binding protein [Deltaproteobacteria bacterium]|nr:(2Fe-2S)-binding protein [Deltaproteobacteria bacterium]
MTPWGIRNRIKSALGRGGKVASDERLRVTLVMPDGQSHEVDAEPRYTLVMASQSLETPIATGCPDGGCGTCSVDVIDGRGLAEPTESESKLLKEKCKPGQRLACHARITGSGAKVKVYSVWSMDQTRGT